MGDRCYPNFHVVTKPVGSLCNLDCDYCYYLEKEQLYASQTFRMSEDVLRSFIRQYIEGQSSTDAQFLWQGGEPTLLGLDYYQKVVELQEMYAGGRRISNSLQTNGMFLDDRWCEFLKRHDFLVGISLDGPAELHNQYRKSKGGSDTHSQVVQAIERMQRHGVRFNILIAVGSHNSPHPLDVYHHLKEVGGTHLQFMPIVERWVESSKNLASLQTNASTQVTPWSVNALDYGRFLIAIFDEWARYDVGRIFVQSFDTALESWLGMEPSLCLFRKTCGNALAVERNGDVYACDHFVFNDYRLGNLTKTSLVDLLESPPQRKFGADKSATLPKQCQQCEVLFACRGECPKNRFIATADGEPGLNYLCEGYLAFFRHIDPVMQRMASLLRNQSLSTERNG